MSPYLVPVSVCSLLSINIFVDARFSHLSIFLYIIFVLQVFTELEKYVDWMTEKEAEIRYIFIYPSDYLFIYLPSVILLA